MIGEDSAFYCGIPAIPSYLLWMGTLLPVTQEK